MPMPDTPGPLDATLRGPVSAADASGPLAGDIRDLAATPAFLMDRPRALISSPARSVGPREAAVEAPDAAALPMVGIAPRRLVVVGVTIILAWLMISFGRQVAEASAASARAADLRAAIAALTVEVAATEHELQAIQEPRYLTQAARAYRLGAVGEIPFALEADAPPLAADAPGSASVRLGATEVSGSPVEAWLDVLFGPGG
jgi:outer membrane murein-binding lipoprotein Lpp